MIETKDKQILDEINQKIKTKTILSSKDYINLANVHLKHKNFNSSEYLFNKATLLEPNNIEYKKLHQHVLNIISFNSYKNNTIKLELI